MQVDKDKGLELLPTGSIVNDSEYVKRIMTDPNVLYNAFRASIKGSKWKGSSQLFSLYFLRNIFKISEMLETQSLVNGHPNDFRIFERGKIREIVSLPVQDRVIRHALCDEILMPMVRPHIIYDNGASVTNRGISFTRKRFEVHLHRYYRLYGNEGYILLSDFKKFYDNIVHETSKNQFLDLYNDDWFLDYLLSTIYTGFNSPRFLPGKGANIGDQLSQTIGIYYPNDIDHYVKTVRSQKFYGRYMDDWYIMSPDKETLFEILEEVSEIADSLGMIINRKKTYICKLSNTFTFLQTRYRLGSGGKIHKHMNPKRYYAMRRKLKKLAKFVHFGELPYERVENMFKSWMGNYYKIMGRSKRKHILELFEDLFGVSITIRKRKMIIESGDVFA